MILFLFGLVVGFFVAIFAAGLMRAAQEYDREGRE